ncbi:hypothetical protein CHS0354_020932 [Potamilus streckersoni]|uniref:Uncharacterized protein n=1 Tax=Potamilus streckersoni TaxID=2493646 RepID=A0AAE0SRP3_9BIVA|nr:hypothetical protein CHS0354_020932 [Potamilus streckersoni]
MNWILSFVWICSLSFGAVFTQTRVGLPRSRGVGVWDPRRGHVGGARNVNRGGMAVDASGHGGGGGGGGGGGAAGADWNSGLSGVTEGIGVTDATFSVGGMGSDMAGMGVGMTADVSGMGGGVEFSVMGMEMGGSIGGGGGINAAMTGGGGMGGGMGMLSADLMMWPSNGNWFYASGPIKVGYRVCPVLAQRVDACGKGPMTPCAPICLRFPAAKCVVNPCGGCFAEWYLNRRRVVDCD